MAKSKDLDLTIKIAGKLDGSLGKSIAQARGQISSFSNIMSSIGKVGLGAMAATATATFAVIADCTKEAEKLQTSMSDVMRYVDGVADANGKASDAIADNGKTYKENYKAIRSYIQDLSTEIPRTTEQLAQASAALGQSGIGVDAQLNQGYLRDVAVAASAMDIDDALAGDYIAKWEQAFNMNHQEIMTLMDQINYLGANNATTAAEIAQSINDAASLGQIAGVDVATTAAIATAMQATGVSTDKVGTSIKRIYTNISKGSSATKAQKEAFESMGMNAEQVAKDMQSAPNATLLGILKGIQNLDKDKQVATMSTLFGQWAIEGGAKIVNNLEAYTSALEQVQSGNYAGSMEREFQITVGTSENSGIMLSNAFKALKQDVGESFLPVKVDAMNMITEVLNNIRKHLPDLERIAEKLMPLIETTIENIGNGINDALPVIEKLIDYVTNNGETAGKIVGGMGAAFTAMTFAPQIEGTAKLISGFGLGGQKNGKSGNVFANLFKEGQKTAGDTGSLLKSLYQASTQGAQYGGGGIKGSLLGAIFGVENKKNLQGGLFSGSSIDTIMDSVKGVQSKGIIGTILGTLSKTGAGQYAGRIKNQAGIATQAMETFGGNILDFPMNMLAGIITNNAEPTALFKGAGLALSGGNAISQTAGIGMTMLGPVASTLGGLFTGALPIVGAISGVIAVTSILYDNMEGLRNVIGNTFGEQGLVAFDKFAGGVETAKNAILGLFEDGGVENAFQGLQNIITNAFGEGAGEKFGEFLDSDAMQAAIGILQSIMGVVGQIVTFAVTTVKPIIQNVFSFITGTVLPKILSMFTAAAPMISTIITNAGTAFMTGMQIIGTAIQIVMPIVQGLITGILNIGSVVLPVAISVISSFTGSISGVLTAIQGIFEGLITFITGAFTGNWQQAWEGVKGIFGNAFDALVELCKVPINAVIGIINGAISGINSIFGSGITIPDWVPGVGGQTYSFHLDSIPMLAKGGFTNGPSIAGEAGQEAVISFDNAYRASNISNWLKAGEMLGMGSALKNIDGAEPASNSTANYTFAPQITIQGNADDRVIDALMNEMKGKFDVWMKDALRRQARTAY